MSDLSLAAGKKRLLGAAVVAVLAASCGQKTAAVIDVEAPRIKTKPVENEAKTKADAAAYDHESARTDWIFSITPEISFTIKDEKEDKSGYHIWIELTGAKLKLALPIVTYVSKKAPQYVLDHENGHVKICTRIYANCREHALAAVNAQIGKQFEGFGPDRKRALSNAIDMAARDIVIPYRTNSAVLAEKVSSNYDQLCEKEDRRKLVDQTVEEAFARAAAEDKKTKPAN